MASTSSRSDFVEPVGGTDFSEGTGLDGLDIVGGLMVVSLLLCAKGMDRGEWVEVQL